MLQKISVLVGLSLFSLTSFAVTIAPSQAQPTCFKRVYSDAHMSSNPKQLLQEMYVKLSLKNEIDGDQQPYTWSPGEVVGVSKGIYYGNTAYCENSKDGSVGCMIECDGGAFSLRNSPRYPGAVNFVVRKDYYFPLFKNRMSSDMEVDVPSISLQDPENRIYRLEPVDARECDRAIEQITKNELGGC